MNLLKSIIDRLNQRVEVANIFDQLYPLCELNANGNEKAWVHYIGNGQAEVVTNFDAKQGTLFWAKRGKVSVVKTESFKVSGCKTLYQTTFPLTAYAVVRKSHLPCDSEDSQDWIASRIYRLISGTDSDFKSALAVISYEVIPNGYVNEIKSLTANYEWACVAVDIDVAVVSASEDGCYDVCATGDIPLPDFQPCQPCLTEVAVDGVTITGNGTTADPLVAVGGGGSSILLQTDGIDNGSQTKLNLIEGNNIVITDDGLGGITIEASGSLGVTDVTATLPLSSTGGSTPDISIAMANATTDGFINAEDWFIFNSKFDQPTGASTDYLDGTGTPTPFPTIPDAQVNSDWNSTSGVSEILNKPSIPTATSDLTNDSGFITIGDVPTQVNSDWNATSGFAEILNKPTIPVVTGFVPYTGATADLDMGTHNVTADHIALNVSPSGAGFVVGATEWNNTLGSSQTLLKGGNVTLKNGVDLVARIVNKVTPNTTLTKANYQAVRVSGATGGRLSVELAQANADANSADTIGLVCETIATNQEGFIQTAGQLLDINTTGSLQGETWADGDVVYLSPTTAGKLTNIKPNGSTGHIVVIGYVEYSHASQGSIYVKIMNGWELDELHNVYINSPANNDALIYESSTQLWKNKSLATALGYTPVTNARTISTTAPLSGGGDLTANRTLSISKATASVDGYLSATDFTTFNGKQNAITPAALTKTDDTNVTLTLGGSPSTSLLAATSLTLGWTGTLADSRIASASTWNAKQSTITLTTTGTSGAATLTGATLNIPQYSTIGIYKNTTDGAASSGTANTFSQSVLVPANSVVIGSVIEFKLRGRKTGGNAVYTIRLYANTTNNLSGTPVLLATYTATQIQALALQMVRTAAIKNVTTNTEMALAATTLATDYTNTTFASIAVDWTTNQYIIGAVQSSNASDSTLISLISMTII